MENSVQPFHVGILVYDEVEVLDCCGPFEVFSVANRVRQRSEGTTPFAVSFIAKEAVVSARGGLALRARQTIAQQPKIDVLVVAGGVTEAVESDQEVVGWLTEVDPLWTTSVCTGVFLLAEAGLVRDRRVTTHWEDQDALASRWPDLTVERDRRWVRDGNVITSGGISAGIDMSLHLVELLTDRDLAVATARQMEYSWTGSHPD